MKKILALVLAALTLLSAVSAFADSGWYCPKCGRLNSDNFCPKDGTPRPAGGDGENPYNPYGNDPYQGYTEPYGYDDPYQGYTDPYGYDYPYAGDATPYSNVTGYLNQRLASRTGPNTTYDEPGSFLKAGAAVTVHAKAWDSTHQIWWLLVEFSEGRDRYWAYTGLKRIDGINIGGIYEEYPLGEIYADLTFDTYNGPSYSYKRMDRDLPAGTTCTIYGRYRGEDGEFLLLEFYDAGAGCLRRAWVPADRF